MNFQVPAFFEDDLNTVVQMGFGQNQSQNFHGLFFFFFFTPETKHYAILVDYISSFLPVSASYFGMMMNKCRNCGCFWNESWAMITQQSKTVPPFILRPQLGEAFVYVQETWKSTERTSGFKKKRIFPPHPFLFHN